MSLLKPGSLCVIVAGCPENIGLIVEVVAHLGSLPPRADAYQIRTVSGRFFPQLKMGPSESLALGYAAEAITDRHKLRPLVDPKDKAEVRAAEMTRPTSRMHEQTTLSAELASTPLASFTLSRSESCIWS